MYSSIYGLFNGCSITFGASKIFLFYQFSERDKCSLFRSTICPLFLGTWKCSLSIYGMLIHFFKNMTNINTCMFYGLFHHFLKNMANISCLFYDLFHLFWNMKNFLSLLCVCFYCFMEPSQSLKPGHRLMLRTMLAPWSFPFRLRRSFMQVVASSSLTKLWFFADGPTIEETRKCVEAD